LGRSRKHPETAVSVPALRIPISPPRFLLEKKVFTIFPNLFFYPGLNTYFCANQNSTNMYSLDCNYYTKEFRTIDELINDVMVSGMDPNYSITFNGKPTGELAIDLIQM
jgi:phosphoribosyl 1,2-cyclic phosphodiesterase